MKLYKLILLLCLMSLVTSCVVLSDNDCVPATLYRVFPQAQYSEIYKACKTDDGGTTVSHIPDAWSQFTTNKLEIVFTVYDVSTFGNKVDYYVPYMWISAGDKNTLAHCSLMYFTPKNVVISDSLYTAGGPKFSNRTISYEEFFTKVLYLYTSSVLTTNIPIR